jgi:signal transduction histidine kinase
MRRMADLKELESAVGHDLNNVLQVVLGNLELLKRRREFLPPTVDAALGATRQAADLAERLLTLRRLQRPEVRPVDLNRLADDLAQVAREMVGEDIEVATDLASGLPRALADVRALHMALRELAANARAAMAQGGRLVLRTENGAQNSVLLELADTGSGMPAERVARAFEPLLSRGERGKPRGLGLYIAECAIRESGGRIELDSAPGAGTRVRIYLPAA